MRRKSGIESYTKLTRFQKWPFLIPLAITGLALLPIGNLLVNTANSDIYFFAQSYDFENERGWSVSASVSADAGAASASASPSITNPDHFNQLVQYVGHASTKAHRDECTIPIVRVVYQGPFYPPEVHHTTKTFPADTKPDAGALTAKVVMGEEIKWSLDVKIKTPPQKRIKLTVPLTEYSQGEAEITWGDTTYIVISGNHVKIPISKPITQGRRAKVTGNKAADKYADLHSFRFGGNTYASMFDAYSAP